MDLDNLISEYVSKTTEELELYRASLGQYGMQNGIPEARVAAINSILANRTSSEEEEQVEEVKEIDDYLIAVKYVNKNKSSARRGISFELSFNEYKRILKKKKCFYTGVTLNNEENHPHSFTIDRKNPSLGYTKDNCVACSLAANAVKNQLLEQGNASLYLGKKLFMKFANKMKDIDFE